MGYEDGKFIITLDCCLNAHSQDDYKDYSDILAGIMIYDIYGDVIPFFLADYLVSETEDFESKVLEYMIDCEPLPLNCDLKIEFEFTCLQANILEIDVLNWEIL